MNLPESIPWELSLTSPTQVNFASPVVVLLFLTGGLNGGDIAIVDLTRGAASCLNALYNPQRLRIGNLAEHNMLSVEP